MAFLKLKSLVVFASIVVQVSSADTTSIYIPGFDPQPVSINVLGAGSDGRTTYELLPGEPTGTWVGQEPAFSGTATLVEGPSDAVLSYANAVMTMGDSCNYANGVATCTNVIGMGSITTIVDTEAATPMVVQVGSASLVTTAGASGATSAAGGTSSAGSVVKTASGTSSAATATHTNGCSKISPNVLMGVVGVIGLSLGMM